MPLFKVLCFGITRELLKGREASIEVEGNTVGDLRRTLTHRFPELKGLKSLYIAVNNDYAPDHQPLMPSDEIALIPPVSGGS